MTPVVNVLDVVTVFGEGGMGPTVWPHAIKTTMQARIGTAASRILIVMA
jgi:hypothetical protein